MTGVEQVRAFLPVLDAFEVRAATGVDRADLARLAGRSTRIDPPATGGGGLRPTIPS